MAIPSPMASTNRRRRSMKVARSSLVILTASCHLIAYAPIAMLRLGVLDQSPGRSDLGIGRAPGSDQMTASALVSGDMPRVDDFPQKIADVLGFMSGTLPPEHPFARVLAMPTGPSLPAVWLLGSSDQSAAMAAHFGTAFSFAHFINADGGGEVTRAYTQAFKPSAILAEPCASVAVFVVCAESHDVAERLAQSRDLFIARLYTGRGGRYPTVAEAEAHEYTPWERQIVEHARGRRVAGTPDECRERLEAPARG